MRRRLPPLNSLRAFEVVARHQSFSAAAKELERYCGRGKPAGEVIGGSSRAKTPAAAKRRIQFDAGRAGRT